MFRAFEWQLALRYMHLRSQEGFVTLIAIFSAVGIMLGVATLIVTLAVMNGFREELLGKVIGFNGHMLFQPYGGKMSDYDEAVAQLKTVDNVIQVSPIIEGQALATFGDYGSGALVRGVRPEDIRKQPLIAGNIVDGTLDDFGAGDNDIIVGRRLADKYGLQIGSLVTLITPKGRVTPFGTVPRLSSYNIRAIFEVGEYNYDSGYFFMPLAQAQSYFQYDDQVAALEITLNDAELISQMYPVVQNKIVDIGLGGRLVDWRILNQSFFQALEIDRNVSFIILTMIILVATFNVISTMIMMVRSKTRDIAILRTMGAGRASIMRAFFIAGSSIGVTGTALGLGLGILIVNFVQELVEFAGKITGTNIWDAEIRFISEVPTSMQLDEVILVLVVSLALSFIATIFPAFRAANIDPVKALRYE